MKLHMLLGLISSRPTNASHVPFPCTGVKRKYSSQADCGWDPWNIGSYPRRPALAVIDGMHASKVPAAFQPSETAVQTAESQAGPGEKLWSCH